MSGARKALKQFITGVQRPTMLTGKVVRTADETCDVEPSDGGPVLYNVRIKPAINNTAFGILPYPKVGSTCIVAELDGNANKYVLLQAEELERVLVKTDKCAIEMKADGTITLNGDGLGGLVKVNELKQELIKVNNFLGALRQALSSAPTSPGDGGSTFKGAVTAAIASLQLPTYQAIENTKVKHGGA